MRIQGSSYTASVVLEKNKPIASLSVAVAALLLAASAACMGQNARPAIIPGAEQGGAGPSGQGSSPGSIGGLTDGPISPGDTVHIIAFGAPDFSVITRVSESGDVAYPILGVIHLSGLNSATSAELIARQLKDRNLMVDPNVIVTVDSASTGLTVLGEVRSPGIYPPLGKHLLSDLLAAAGGLTANTGRVIEISNEHTPDQKTYIPWDPTMHNTVSYDRPVHPGDRIFVRACGIAYVGGNVQKPGAYSLCGSPQMTLSEVVALAGGVAPLVSNSHTFLIRADADGTKVARQIDMHKVQTAKEADPIIKEDDIIYLSHSDLKDALTRIAAATLDLAGPLIYSHP
jgi:polysaccharide export outer membrane protein